MVIKREKVILLQNDKVGEKYQTKELRKGFVINYLLPRVEVLLYNSKNVSQIVKQKKSEKRRNQLLKTQAQELAERINNLTLNFTLNKDKKGETFGSVGHREILVELAKLGFRLQKKQLLNFQPLRQVGESLIKAKINSNLITQIKVVIN